MKIARVAMLGVALAAGGAAAYLASGSKPAPAPQVVQAPASMQTRRGARRGKRAQFRSGGRRRRHLLAGLGPTPARAYSSARARTRTRSRTSSARSLLRGTFLAGEPFRRDRLVKGPTAGLMSTMPSTGM